MGHVLLDPPAKTWVCPSCGYTEMAKGQDNRWHRCGKQAGVLVPLVLEGTKAKHVLLEREDYEGEQLAQRDENGRAVMSLLTIRDNGQDCTVLAPTAVIGEEARV